MNAVHEFLFRRPNKTAYIGGQASNYTGSDPDDPLSTSKSQSTTYGQPHEGGGRRAGGGMGACDGELLAMALPAASASTYSAGAGRT